MSDLIMDGEQRRQYVFDRKLHPDPARALDQTKSLRRVIIHHAQRTQEVEELLGRAGVLAERYVPKKSTEAHFYVIPQGDLHVVNSRGITRGIRDEDQAKALSDILCKPVPLALDHYQNDPASVSKRFEDFAYDLVRDAFNHLDTDEIQLKRSFPIIIGPQKHLTLDGIVCEHSDDNDYLSYKVLRIGKQPVLAFDYIFADQAKNVLSRVYATANAYLPGTNMHVLHYGKIGLLNPFLDVGQVCVPHAALDENKAVDGDLRPSPIHNQLALHTPASRIFKETVGQPIARGMTINTVSVLQQTKTRLQTALDAGGDFLDMEWAVMASLDHGYNSMYPSLGRINYYFAGVGSDKPLAGKTLGDTEFPQEKLSLIAEAYTRIIRASR